MRSVDAPLINQKADPKFKVEIRKSVGLSIGNFNNFTHNKNLPITSRQPATTRELEQEDFGQTLKTSRTLTSIKSTSHMLTSRYQTVMQKYPSNGLMKLVAINNRGGGSSLQLEDKVT